MKEQKKIACFREVKEKESSLQITKGNEFCFNISTLVEKKNVAFYIKRQRKLKKA